MTHGLANIFVNNQRVEDLDNPQLRIRDIIEAYGRNPDRCIVYRLASEDEGAGDRVDLNDRVDLAHIRGALYLRCETRRTEVHAPSPGGATAIATGEEELMEFEQIPEYEGAEEEPQAAVAPNDEVPREELLSPTTGGEHAQGDPSGQKYSDREPEPRGTSGEQEPIAHAANAPSALGSERNPPAESERPPRRPAASRRGRGFESTQSTTPTRTSSARRTNNQKRRPPT
ncbi:MAG TPA: hypothetical protein VGB18_05345 [Candidatus Thermoplasmatota archaeon]